MEGAHVTGRCLGGRGFGLRTIHNRVRVAGTTSQTRNYEFGYSFRPAGTIGNLTVHRASITDPYPNSVHVNTRPARPLPLSQFPGTLKVPLRLTRDIHDHTMIHSQAPAQLRFTNRPRLDIQGRSSGVLVSKPQNLLLQHLKVIAQQNLLPVDDLLIQQTQDTEEPPRATGIRLGIIQRVVKGLGGGAELSEGGCVELRDGSDVEEAGEENRLEHASGMAMVSSPIAAGVFDVEFVARLGLGVQVEPPVILVRGWGVVTNEEQDVDTANLELLVQLFVVHRGLFGHSLLSRLCSSGCWSFRDGG